MSHSTTFILDGSKVELNFDPASGLAPTTTVLDYLRSLPDHRGVKEGCAEGDCGACTVVVGELTSDGRINYRAVDSCLMFLPMLHGKLLVTVENLRTRDGDLHPVQQAMVNFHGSQCGFCTPGIVMSLFALGKNSLHPSTEDAKVALAGNLCRCTGYRPIVDAATNAGTRNDEGNLAIEETTVVKLLRSIPRQSVSIVTRRQRYDQPVSLKEALALAKRYPKAILINGATDVALRVTKRFELLPHIIDISRVRDLTRIAKTKKGLTIGSGVKVDDLVQYTKRDFPALSEMLSLFGAKQIRNIATVGGNIGTASPIGDILPVLMAYDAMIELRSTKSRRTVSANQFVIGYRQTERKRDEIIAAIVLPLPAKNLKVRAYKISKRRDLDIATVSAGFSVRLDDEGIVERVVLAYGGMAERTKRAAFTEGYLIGKPWSRAVIEQAQKSIEKDFRPISDVRGSAEFRGIVARNLLMKFWNDTK